MSDTWDDVSDEASDAWDVDSDDGALEAKLGLNRVSAVTAEATFDDEEDLAVKEKAEEEARSKALLKTKGKALAAKKAAEADRKEEEELARKVMELEVERESSMTAEERKMMERRRIEEADAAIANDLFGGFDDRKVVGVAGAAMGAGDTVKMVDLKDHLKHAKKVGACIRGHKNVHLASAFIKEVLQECKDVLDDDAITELIKTMNVIKNDKLTAAKRKVKGQAQKTKRDKAAEAKAKQIQVELYGNSDKFDKYDEYGEQYEDDFF